MASPPTGEELAVMIEDKGNEIRQLKFAKTSKDDLKPHIDELLALKTKFQSTTGAPYVAPGQEKKTKPAPAATPAAPVDPNKKSKKQLQREKKEAEKAIAKAKAKEERERKQAEAAASGGGSAHESTPEGQEWRYGDLPMVQSSEMTGKTFCPVGDLTSAKAGEEIWLRARVHTSRSIKKGVFLVLRQALYTVQATVFVGGNVGRPMVQYAEDVSKESVIDVRGTLVVTPSPVSGCTQKEVELKIEEIHVVSAADTFMPVIVADAMRPDRTPEEEEKQEKEGKAPTVAADTRLDYRWIDLRTPANQAIFKIQSAVCQYFRANLASKGFVEIHSPKLLAGASEGGSEVFTTNYFGTEACLAQSPQLYKQMAAACGGFGRVMEVGPVFRAEKSRTHRHLCEFTGLDFEMVIKEHYFEVLEVFSDLFINIFDELNRNCKEELEAVRTQHPFEDLRYARPTLRLTFQEGIQLLIDAGYDADPLGDLSTEHEKKLGDLVAAKYGTDFFMMDKYPLDVRPFYTMPCPSNPKHSNSFDIFIRGEEIVSGAQRIHDLEFLKERAREHDIPLDSIMSYLDAFKHGAEPHGGGGIGLERVVMLFLGLKNIRKTSMFPRDPKRCAP
ncbi:unnamed protein product [Ectocarpus sp. 6 AP-2014]